MTLLCDIFIEYQAGEDEEVRSQTVKQMIMTESKSIEVLSLEYALSKLNITIEDLNKVDHIGVEFIKDKKDKRFERIYTQSMGSTEIWVDKETGVNYLFHSSGYAGGLTVLLDREGKPVITPVVE